MSKLHRYGAAVSCACLATYSFGDDSNLSNYFRVSVFSLLLCALVSFVYSKFIYPFYTSPLLELPIIPRRSWKECLSLLPPPTYLEAMDNIPNDGLLRRIDILNEQVVVLTKPSLAAEFLQQRADDYEKIPPIRRILIDMLGSGLVSAEDVDHKIQRKALAPAFGFPTVKKLYPLFWKKASEMVSLIKDEISPQTSAGLDAVLNMDDWSARVTIDIVGEAGFGSRFSALTHPFTPLNKGYRSAFIVDATSRVFFMLSFLTTPALTNLLPFKRVQDRAKGYKVVRSWIRDTIEERKKDMYYNVDDIDYLDKAGHTDIISAVMRSGTLNLDGLVEQSLTFLGAGHETSATALAWAIHELSQPEHANYQRSLRAEIRANFPSPTSSIPMTSELLDSLPLLDAISKEVLRLHAPIITIGRRARRDTILGGVRIPKHTHVRVSPWAMNQARSIWGEDARTFRPERWIEGGSTGGTGENLAATLVFGHGLRGCIGKSFAQAEHKALIAALIGTFEFRQVGNVHVDPVNVFGITGKILGLDVETKLVEGW